MRIASHSLLLSVESKSLRTSGFMSVALLVVRFLGSQLHWTFDRYLLPKI